MFSSAQRTLHKHNKPTSLPSVAFDLAITALNRFCTYASDDTYARTGK